MRRHHHGDQPSTTRWCPQCRAEYRAGFEVCDDCGVALVDDAPPEAAAPEPRRSIGMEGTFRPGEDIVELARLRAVEAEIVAGRLREAGIRVAVLAVGTAGELAAVQYSEGSRLVVYRADLDAARRIVDAADTVDTGALDDDELGDLAERTPWTDPGTGAVV